MDWIGHVTCMTHGLKEIFLQNLKKNMFQNNYICFYTTVLFSIYIFEIHSFLTLFFKQLRPKLEEAEGKSNEITSK